MPELTVFSDDTRHKILFSPGSTLRELLDAAGLRVRSGCRGNGACGLCLVRLEAGNVNSLTDNERLNLTPEQLQQNIRLACQLRPENDLSVRIINPPPISGQGDLYSNEPCFAPTLFEAFIKLAQYTVRLKTQQDIRDHLGKFITTHFPADWTAFVQRDPVRGISVDHCTPADALDTERILTEDIRTLIADVLDSGFLASQVILTPAPSMTAFLPIVEEYHSEKVLLVGHSSAGPLSKELLNIYLAIAGLAGTTFERLRNERELNRHRAHLEELVKERTAELDAANKELEAFTYSASHDLLAPLRHIESFSKILQEDYEDRLGEEGKGFLQRILGATLRMGRLIDDLLALSKVSRNTMKRRTVNLSSLVKNIADELARLEPKRKVSFIVEEGLVDEGDEGLLFIALQNLLGNSWKFTGKRQEAAIEFGALLSDGKRIYFVKDNGAGFDMAFADRLFKPFQRLHGTGEFDGTGIGLATVHRIIQRHGGRVWAEGEVERGAVFYFTLA